MATTYSLFDIGACNCPSSSCSQTFNVFGCAGLNASDTLTVSVFDSTGATLLGSATTSTGVATVSWSGASGLAHIVTVTGQSSRFAAFSTTLTLTCGGTKTLGLLPAAGYSCVLGCTYPIANSINLSFPSMDLTVTNPGGGPAWSTTFTIDGNDYLVQLNAGPGGSITIVGFGAGICTITQTGSVCPPSYMDTFLMTESPAGACSPFGAGTATATE
jgi:hypothetical protein